MNYTDDIWAPYESWKLLYWFLPYMKVTGQLTEWSFGTNICLQSVFNIDSFNGLQIPWPLLYYYKRKQTWNQNRLTTFSLLDWKGSLKSLKKFKDDIPCQ